MAEVVKGHFRALAPRSECGWLEQCPEATAGSNANDLLLAYALSVYAADE